jgi:putative ABC transport system permease protein
MGSNIWSFVEVQQAENSNGVGSAPTLTVGDAGAILAEVYSVKCAPDLGGIAQVVYGNQNWSTFIVGTVQDARD